MTEAYVDGKRMRLDPAKAVGKGGEADIFKIDPQTVLKLFKAPGHPDFMGNPADDKDAQARLDEHQTKLRDFPKNLPAKVVAPSSLVTDRSGRRILGYTMPFLDKGEVLYRYSEPSFRQGGPDNQEVVNIFLGMLPTVKAVHDAQVILGDFNDLNIIVVKDEPFFIDADSFQFGHYFCKVYTERFVDPTHCAPNEKRPVMVRPHDQSSDWYAFNVMLMRSLLCCDPYGGVYKPAKKAQQVLHTERPLRRLTIFQKDVRYPRAAVPFERLSDELLHHFHLVFEKDERGEFPIRLLKSFRWEKCSNCGTEHGKAVCPDCKTGAKPVIREVVQVRGKVTSTRIFTTFGEILYATVQNGELKWLYHENKEYKREDGKIAFRSEFLRDMRYRIHGKETLAGHDGAFIVSAEVGAPPQIHVDRYGHLPVFGANEKAKYWIYQGVLKRDGILGPERIGDVLQDQTLFWVGPKFGFGFYRAGELNMAFVFDAEHGGLNDTVSLGRIPGQLVDSTCFFSKELCWFMVSFRHEGRAKNRCVTLDQKGSVVASHEAEEGDGSWLSDIRGKCASGKSLFSVTAEGVVRIEPDGNRLMVATEWPDTEPFAHPGCQLFPGAGGLYAVDRKEIRVLKIG